ncbi:MAG: hypothetical protein PHR77_01015 [Kiritimatiellae bacterium]|nr:hypothetical protein [Kiritimatiellia bacterium]MDD5519312.1 hypothetical protein [Kiritimatiellia bacterium]
MRILKTWIVVGFAGVFAVSSFAATNSTINSTQKWTWSSSVGWLNCKSDSTSGVVVGQYFCSGFMYNSSVGWICLGDGSPSNGFQYATNSATDYGVNHDGQGHLSGYAWSPSAGWISFCWTNATDPQAPKVDLQTGHLSGYVWGTGVGWISLSNSTWGLKTDILYQGETTSNTNGIPDAWVWENFTTTNGFLAYDDADTDGVYNVDEYIADTDPRNSNDYLSISGVEVSTNGLQLTWSSKESRFYSIDMKTSLFDTVWIDSGLGTNAPDVGSNTVVLLPVNTQGYFRIKAAIPPLVQ